MNKKILIIGSGKIGVCIAFLFRNIGGYSVTVVDKNEASVVAVDADVEKIVMDILDEPKLTKVMQDKDVVVSAVAFSFNTYIAKVADKTGTHYFDLTEDVEQANNIEQIAKNSEVSFMPQCGLAPGFVGISAYHLAKKFDTLDTLKMRVGALPLYPNNRLKYNLNWSSEGLINEYCNPCDAVVEGMYTKVNPLEDCEVLNFDGVEYEAFNTSGGLGHLHKSLSGKVRMLNYKTIRYVGHREVMKLLLEDLRFSEDRENFKKVLENSVPATDQDVVIVFVSATGIIDGKLQQKSYLNKVYSGKVLNKLFTAIQITTAVGICAAVDIHSHGKLSNKGFIVQEDIDFEDFMANRFGKLYDKLSCFESKNRRFVEGITTI